MSEPQPSPRKTRVIDSVWTFLVATAVLGPFALPLLWRNPRFKVSTKIAGSVAVVLFTIALMKWAGEFLDASIRELLGEAPS